jgi:hypothetical protein
MVFWYNPVLAIQLIPIERLLYILNQIISNSILFSENLAKKRYVLALGCFLLRHSDLPPEVKSQLPILFNDLLMMVKNIIQKIDQDTDDEDEAPYKEGESGDKWRDVYA